MFCSLFLYFLFFCWNFSPRLNVRIFRLCSTWNFRRGFESGLSFILEVGENARSFEVDGLWLIDFLGLERLLGVGFLFSWFENSTIYRVFQHFWVYKSVDFLALKISQFRPNKIPIGLSCYSGFFKLEDQAKIWWDENLRFLDSLYFWI